MFPDIRLDMFCGDAGISVPFGEPNHLFLIELLITKPIR
jgi:hypothetical protein